MDLLEEKKDMLDRRNRGLRVLQSTQVLGRISGVACHKGRENWKQVPPPLFFILGHTCQSAFHHYYEIPEVVRVKFILTPSFTGSSLWSAGCRPGEKLLDTIVKSTWYSQLLTSWLEIRGKGRDWGLTIPFKGTLLPQPCVT